MKVNSLYFKLIHLGIADHHTIEFSSRLKTLNKFNLLCISYSIPYILFSLCLHFYQPALVFFIGQLLYVGSMYSSNRAWYNLARFLTIIATNCSVFYLSLFYGFTSGFHLYYFTSPLIVFSLFNFSESIKIIFGMGLYIVSVGVLILLNHSGLIFYHEIPQPIAFVLYSINVFVALSFCLLLVTHFSSFNKKINDILLHNNIELEKKQNLLEIEIIERKNTEMKLQTLLKDKETLLSETHHRVKNNLAVVSGMLDLQMLMSHEPKIKAVLGDSRSRIQSMSLIHESLYKYDNVSQIEFGRYIRNLSEEIRQAYVSEALDVTMVYHLDKVYLDVTKAIPCGLLLNEVLTNAFKHAFKGRAKGEIVISFEQSENICILEIRDNGRGFDDSMPKSSQSIGMTLISAFVKQLKGQYELTGDNGTKMKLTFEV